MTDLAHQFADWAGHLDPTDEDLALAQRSLRDTLAVTLAARTHRLAAMTAGLVPDAARWAAIGHVLDFDDLHMQSTTHISVVCVPAVLACGGDARAYLAAAGVMARLGNLLGWPHYAAGWHATCTAGAPAAAVGAAVALGLDVDGIATAIALSLPGAGGVQRAFGTDAKSLQVGFAVESGVRAARLAAAGARADLGALDAWLRLVAPTAAAEPAGAAWDGPAVPGGLAIKIYPACYALQRPISAVSGIGAARALADRADGTANPAVRPEEVTRIVLRTPEATVTPLIHHRPTTGLQAKFSLEYAVAAALLDAHQGFDSFTDAAAQRPQAQRLAGLVETVLEPGGNGLLDGELDVEIHTASGAVARSRLRYPPGSPQRLPTEAELRTKIDDCLRAAGLPDIDPADWSWPTAPRLLHTHLDAAAAGHPPVPGSAGQSARP